VKKILALPNVERTITRVVLNVVKECSRLVLELRKRLITQALVIMQALKFFNAQKTLTLSLTHSKFWQVDLQWRSELICNSVICNGVQASYRRHAWPR